MVCIERCTAKITSEFSFSTETEPPINTSWEHDRDAVMAGIKNQNPEGHALLEEASQFTYNEIRQLERHDLLPAILESSRRLTSIFYGSKFSTDTGYQNPERIRKRITDIAFDLISFRGIHVSEEIIVQTLNILPKLEFSYLPFARFKAGFELAKFPRISKTDIYDTGDLNVRRSVWEKWKPKGKSIIDDVITLRRCVWGRLNDLGPFITRSQEHAPKYESDYAEGITLDTLIENDPMQQYEQQAAISMSSKTFRDYCIEWYKMAENLTLSQVVAILEQVPSEVRFLMLIKFGYIRPGLAIPHILSELQVGQTTYEYGFKKGIDIFAKKLAENSTLPPPTVSLFNLATSAEEKGVIRLNGRVVPLWSPRYRLRTVYMLKDFRQQLTSTEQAILDKLVAVDEDNNFLFSQEDIATQTSCSKQNVILIINKLNHLIDSLQPRFIYVNGRKMSENSLQYALIEQRALLKPYQLAALTVDERRFLDEVSIPNEQGRYIKQSTANRRGSRSLVTSIEKAEWVIQIKQKLSDLLYLSEETLSLPEKQFIETTLSCIENGISIKKKGVNKINIDQICEYLSQSKESIQTLVALLNDT